MGCRQSNPSIGVSSIHSLNLQSREGGLPISAGKVRKSSGNSSREVKDPQKPGDGRKPSGKPHLVDQGCSPIVALRPSKYGISVQGQSSQSFFPRNPASAHLNDERSKKLLSAEITEQLENQITKKESSLSSSQKVLPVIVTQRSGPDTSERIIQKSHRRSASQFTDQRLPKVISPNPHSKGHYRHSHTDTLGASSQAKNPLPQLLHSKTDSNSMLKKSLLNASRNSLPLTQRRSSNEASEKMDREDYTSDKNSERMYRKSSHERRENQQNLIPEENENDDPQLSFSVDEGEDEGSFKINHHNESLQLMEGELLDQINNIPIPPIPKPQKSDLSSLHGTRPNNPSLSRQQNSGSNICSQAELGNTSVRITKTKRSLNQSVSLANRSPANNTMMGGIKKNMGALNKSLMNRSKLANDTSVCFHDEQSFLDYSVRLNKNMKTSKEDHSGGNILAGLNNPSPSPTSQRNNRIKKINHPANFSMKHIVFSGFHPKKCLPGDSNKGDIEKPKTFRKNSLNFKRLETRSIENPTTKKKNHLKSGSEEQQKAIKTKNSNDSLKDLRKDSSSKDESLIVNDQELPNDIPSSQQILALESGSLGMMENKIPQKLSSMEKQEDKATVKRTNSSSQNLFNTSVLDKNTYLSDAGSQATIKNILTVNPQIRHSILLSNRKLSEISEEKILNQKRLARLSEAPLNDSENQSKNQTKYEERVEDTSELKDTKQDLSRSRASKAMLTFGTFGKPTSNNNMSKDLSMVSPTEKSAVANSQGKPTMFSPTNFQKMDASNQEKPNFLKRINKPGELSSKMVVLKERTSSRLEKRKSIGQVENRDVYI